MHYEIQSCKKYTLCQAHTDEALTKMLKESLRPRHIGRPLHRVILEELEVWKTSSHETPQRDNLASYNFCKQRVILFLSAFQLKFFYTFLHEP